MKTRLVRKIEVACLSFVVLLSCGELKVQDTTNDASGTLYGDAFVNANYNFQSNYASFRLNRVHLGYKYRYNQHLYFNGMLESAREDYEAIGDYNNITNLFEFCLGFNYKNIEGKAGLIGTALNPLQEQFWKHRYIDKVFADKYGFAPTNDFGFLTVYKPNDLLNFDVSITNGEGHKNPQYDSTFRYALGATIHTSQGLVFRIYGDFVPEDVTEINAIALIGYSGAGLTLGAEYNYKINKQFIENYTQGGLSAYGSYDISSKLEIFGRYDNVMSDYPEGFTPLNEISGQLIIGGLQYTIHPKILLSLNNRNWIQKTDNETNSFLFLDLAINF